MQAGGFARLGKILSPRTSDRLRELYPDHARFRSTIDMQRFRFGRGEYRYFSYPLPADVDRLRHELYLELLPVARQWSLALHLGAEYPPELDDFLRMCHRSGQRRPTPLLLRYRAGDFNCLHQDLYGALFFPFQVIVSLSEPGTDFSGGELLLVEQRPRAQSIGRALSLEKGEAVAIATRFRPVQGKRGIYRSTFRHGVSPVTHGERYTLGIIFHDAA